MKNTYTFYIRFPYHEYISYLNSINEYDSSDDIINDRDFSIEDIENTWNLEFFYPNGKIHKWYEDNKWWKNDDIYKEFCEVDGKVDLNTPPLFNGIQLNKNHTYTLECIEDDTIPHKRFVDRIIKSRIKGKGGWKIHDV